MKHEVFRKELDYIKDDRIRSSCEIILDMLPDYFYEIPASSTGKYHPDFSLGDGGLVRHVKVAVRIAKELLDNPCTFASKRRSPPCTYLARQANPSRIIPPAW